MKWAFVAFAVVIGGSLGIARLSTLGDPIPRIKPRNFAPKPPQVCTYQLTQTRKTPTEVHLYDVIICEQDSNYDGMVGFEVPSDGAK